MEHQVLADQKQKKSAYQVLAGQKYWDWMLSRFWLITRQRLAAYQISKNDLLIIPKNTNYKCQCIGSAEALYIWWYFYWLGEIIIRISSWEEIINWKTGQFLLNRNEWWARRFILNSYHFHVDERTIRVHFCRWIDEQAFNTIHTDLMYLKAQRTQCFGLRFTSSWSECC